MQLPTQISIITFNIKCFWLKMNFNSYMFYKVLFDSFPGQLLSSYILKSASYKA